MREAFSFLKIKKLVKSIRVGIDTYYIHNHELDKIEDISVSPSIFFQNLQFRLDFYLRALGLSYIKIWERVGIK